MDSESTLFDAELDAPRQRPRAIPVEPAAACQRLVVNPFLAVLGWLAAAGLIRHSLQSHNLALHLSALIWLFVPYLLIQYHCLDCHATGWYVRSRRHLCPPVLDRLARGGKASHWPRARTQLVLWLYFVFVLGLFYILRIRPLR